MGSANRGNSRGAVGGDIAKPPTPSPAASAAPDKGGSDNSGKPQHRPTTITQSPRCCYKMLFREVSINSEVAALVAVDLDG